jgi:biotin carboxyl carrier protein
VRYRINVEGKKFEIEIRKDGRVWVNGHLIEVDIEGIRDNTLYSLLVNHHSFEAQAELPGYEEQQVFIAGRPYKTWLIDQDTLSIVNTHRVQNEGPAEITAPLPGWLSEFSVSDGQFVETGEVVAVMESMKMLLKLRTPQAGVVHLVGSKDNREVSQGEILAVIN